MEKILLTDYDALSDENFDNFISGAKKGVIKLPVPVLDIRSWYGGGGASYRCLLGLSEEEMEKVVYYANYVMHDEKTDTFKIVTEKEARSLKESDPDAKLYIGAEAVLKMLKAITKDRLAELFKTARDTEVRCMGIREKLRDDAKENGSDIEDFRYDIACGDDEKETKLTKEQEEYIQAGKDLDDARHMIDAVQLFSRFGTDLCEITEISLFPLDVRSAVQDLQKQTFYEISNLKWLYFRILSRCIRINKLTELEAPDIILRNEKRMLQEYVDTLIDNGRRCRPVSDNYSKIPLFCLRDLADRKKVV